MKKILEELKAFIFRGNVIDMAVGVIIGAAFSAIINSLVTDIFTPLLSLLTSRIDFNNLFLALDGNSYATVAAAEAAGAAMIKYGSFITNIINFLLIAVCIFFFIKLINKLVYRKEKDVPEEKKPRLCPYCKGEVQDEATRCPHCTSDISDSVILPEQQEIAAATEVISES